MVWVIALIDLVLSKRFLRFQINITRKIFRALKVCLCNFHGIKKKSTHGGNTYNNLCTWSIATKLPSTKDGFTLSCWTWPANLIFRIYLLVHSSLIAKNVFYINVWRDVFIKNTLHVLVLIKHFSSYSLHHYAYRLFNNCGETFQ